MARKLKETKVAPIPTTMKKEWNALIKETRDIVARQDHTHFDLIVLAGQVDTKYGEDKLGRWADEAHIGYPQARQYRFMFRKGMNAAFIDKWCKPKTKGKTTTPGLSYTVVREISQYCGSITSSYALEYLQWALEHKATSVSIRGYMQENDAPHQHKDQAFAAIKVALRDKQEHEGFSDFIRTELEKIAESKPDFEDKILGTVITDEKSLTALKVMAGVIGEEEKKLVEECKKALDRLRKLRRWMNQNSDKLKEGIAYNHEISQELKHMCQMLGENLTELGNVKLIEHKPIPKKKIKEVPTPRSKTQTRTSLELVK